eukprot:4882948-Prymnesium_polylepis.1
MPPRSFFDPQRSLAHTLEQRLRLTPWPAARLSLAFLTAPSERLRNKVEKIAESLGYDKAAHRPLLGLHVRQGDACTDDPAQAAQKGRECASLDAYMPAVHAMVRKVRESRVAARANGI